MSVIRSGDEVEVRLYVESEYRGPNGTVLTLIDPNDSTSKIDMFETDVLKHHPNWQAGDWARFSGIEVEVVSINGNRAWVKGVSGDQVVLLTSLHSTHGE